MTDGIVVYRKGYYSHNHQPTPMEAYEEFRYFISQALDGDEQAQDTLSPLWEDVCSIVVSSSTIQQIFQDNYKPQNIRYLFYSELYKNHKPLSDNGNAISSFKASLSLLNSLDLPVEKSTYSYNQEEEDPKDRLSKAPFVKEAAYLMQKAYKLGYTRAKDYASILFMYSSMIYLRGYIKPSRELEILFPENIDEAIPLFRLALKYYADDAQLSYGEKYSDKDLTQWLSLCYDQKLDTLIAKGLYNDALAYVNNTEYFFQRRQHYIDRIYRELAREAIDKEADESKAFEFLKHTTDYETLADYYMEGKVVDVDYATAALLYAKCTIRSTKNKLAHLYHNGLGVEKDIILAAGLISTDSPDCSVYRCEAANIILAREDYSTAKIPTSIPGSRDYNRWPLNILSQQFLSEIKEHDDIELWQSILTRALEKQDKSLLGWIVKCYENICRINSRKDAIVSSQIKDNLFPLFDTTEGIDRIVEYRRFYNSIKYEGALKKACYNVLYESIPGHNVDAQLYTIGKKKFMTFSLEEAVKYCKDNWADATADLMLANSSKHLILDYIQSLLISSNEDYEKALDLIGFFSEKSNWYNNWFHDRLNEILRKSVNPIEYYIYNEGYNIPEDYKKTLELLTKYNVSNDYLKNYCRTKLYDYYIEQQDNDNALACVAPYGRNIQAFAYGNKLEPLISSIKSEISELSDLDEILECWKKLSTLRLQEADFQMASIYEQKGEYGESFRLYKKIIGNYESKNSSWIDYFVSDEDAGLAYYHIGTMLEVGKGVEANEKEAIDAYTKACLLCNASAFLKLEKLVQVDQAEQIRGKSISKVKDLLRRRRDDKSAIASLIETGLKFQSKLFLFIKLESIICEIYQVPAKDFTVLLKQVEELIEDGNDYSRETGYLSSITSFKTWVYYMLFDIYINGINVKKDINKACAYMLKIDTSIFPPYFYFTTANYNYEKLLRTIANTYLDGNEVVTSDQKKAYDLYYQLAMRGDAESISVLVTAASNNDIAKAKLIEYYKQEGQYENAYKLGDDEAKELLAKVYLQKSEYAFHHEEKDSDGDYMPVENPTEGLRLLKMAVDLDYKEAIIRYAIYLFEKFSPLSPQRKESIKYLKKSVELGSVRAKSLLIMPYFKGEGVPQNVSLAKQYIYDCINSVKKEDLGYISYDDRNRLEKEESQKIWREAYSVLAQMYLQGKGVIQSHSRALVCQVLLNCQRWHWSDNEYKFDNCESLLIEIGKQFENGIGYLQNYYSAIKCYEKAFERVSKSLANYEQQQSYNSRYTHSEEHDECQNTYDSLKEVLNRVWYNYALELEPLPSQRQYDEIPIDTWYPQHLAIMDERRRDEISGEKHKDAFVALFNASKYGSKDAFEAILEYKDNPHSQPYTHMLIGKCYYLGYGCEKSLANAYDEYLRFVKTLDPNGELDDFVNKQKSDWSYNIINICGELRKEGSITSLNNAIECLTKLKEWTEQSPVRDDYGYHYSDHAYSLHYPECMRLFQECHLSIAILYEKEHDYLKAEEHYTAVESSSVLPQLANCQYKMAVCYEKGKGVWKNEEEALEYYNRARTNGSIAASLCLLHKKYRPGYTADDYEKIEFDLIELIKLGSGDAYYEAGLLLFDPAYRNYYRQRLHGSAQAFFREAVDFGNVKAGFYLADLLLKENSNEPIIINLLESAIAINMPQAKYALAKLYNEGIIVPNNKLKAKLLFEEVLKYVSNADLSDGEAQYLYARLYFDGCAIERDTKKYMERLRLSAYYDYAIAIDELSSLYREGSIVSQSDDFCKAYIEKWGKERSCNTDNDDIEAYSKFSEK